ncbi:hypothetical protein ACHAWF_018443, partial [Thalassiosira exigua]
QNQYGVLHGRETYVVFSSKIDAIPECFAFNVLGTRIRLGTCPKRVIWLVVMKEGSRVIRWLRQLHLGVISSVGVGVNDVIASLCDGANVECSLVRPRKHDICVLTRARRSRVEGSATTNHSIIIIKYTDVCLFEWFPILINYTFERMDGFDCRL